jgi:N4-(beta-N-acetylglucosaminyl)-L-asparaginase
MGRTPDEACKEAVTRIVKRDPVKMKEIQVGFLALSKTGEVGAFAISKGFTYVVTSSEFPKGRIFEAPSWFKE